MTNGKLGFSSVQGCYNKGYKKSGLNNEVSKIEEQIAALKIKQEVFSAFTKLQESIGNMVSFNEIKSVNLENEWVTSGQYADNYGTDEEIYVFEIQTDAEVFSVLLEFLGEEDKLERNVYHLHASNMNEASLLKVKEAVLNEFDGKRQEVILITHRHTTLEKELDKLFEWVVCGNDYVYKSYGMGTDKTSVLLLKKGKSYRVEKGEYGLSVELENDSMRFFNTEESREYFPTLF